MFIATKRLERRSEKILFLYRFNIEKMLEKSEKNVCVMNTDDIRGYLSSYQEQNGVSKATVDIDKGMPIEQVQHLLGHEKIDTTLRYAMVKQSNVKMAHKKYIG